MGNKWYVTPLSGEVPGYRLTMKCGRCPTRETSAEYHPAPGTLHSLGVSEAYVMRQAMEVHCYEWVGGVLVCPECLHPEVRLREGDEAREKEALRRIGERLMEVGKDLLVLGGVGEEIDEG